jgi:replication factor A1
MVISELTSGQGNVNVEGTITEVGESRTFSKFGREMTVANAMLKDDSGSIKLTLWNDDVTKYKEGDKVKIENGYVNEFQGENQLTSGKFGKIEKVGEGEVSEEPKEDEAPAEESTEDKSEESADEEKPAEEESTKESVI